MRMGIGFSSIMLAQIVLFYVLPFTADSSHLQALCRLGLINLQSVFLLCNRKSMTEEMAVANKKYIDKLGEMYYCIIRVIQ